MHYTLAHTAGIVDLARSLRCSVLAYLRGLLAEGSYPLTVGCTHLLHLSLLGLRPSSTLASDLGGPTAPLTVATPGFLCSGLGLHGP